MRYDDVVVNSNTSTILNEYLRIKHPNVLRHLAFVTNHKRQCKSAADSTVIVTEYIENGTLRQDLRRREARRGAKALEEYFPLTDVWCIFLQLLLGLRHLHKHQLVHRDVTTQNIFLGFGGAVKLGHCHPFDYVVNASLLPPEVVTGRIKGDASPSEADYHARGEGMTRARTMDRDSRQPWREYECENLKEHGDMWLLGCVLYEVLTLHRLTEERLKTWRHSLANSPQLPKVWCQRFTRILAGLLTPDPQLRPTIQQLLSSSDVLHGYHHFTDSSKDLSNHPAFKHLFYYWEKSGSKKFYYVPRPSGGLSSGSKGAPDGRPKGQMTGDEWFQKMEKGLADSRLTESGLTDSRLTDSRLTDSRLTDSRMTTESRLTDSQDRLYDMRKDQVGPRLEEKRHVHNSKTFRTRSPQNRQQFAGSGGSAQGSPERRTPDRGAPERGTLHLGTAERGSSEQRTPDRGTPEQTRGALERKTSEQKTAERKTSERGSLDRVPLKTSSKVGRCIPEESPPATRPATEYVLPNTIRRSVSREAKERLSKRLSDATGEPQSFQEDADEPTPQRKIPDDKAVRDAKTEAYGSPHGRRTPPHRFEDDPASRSEKARSEKARSEKTRSEKVRGSKVRSDKEERMRNHPRSDPPRSDPPRSDREERIRERPPETVTGENAGVEDAVSEQTSTEHSASRKVAPAEAERLGSRKALRTRLEVAALSEESAGRELSPSRLAESRPNSQGSRSKPQGSRSPGSEQQPEGSGSEPEVVGRGLDQPFARFCGETGERAGSLVDKVSRLMNNARQSMDPPSHGPVSSRTFADRRAAGEGRGGSMWNGGPAWVPSARRTFGTAEAISMRIRQPRSSPLSRHCPDLNPEPFLHRRDSSTAGRRESGDLPMSEQPFSDLPVTPDGSAKTPDWTAKTPDWKTPDWTAKTTTEWKTSSWTGKSPSWAGKACDWKTPEWPGKTPVWPGSRPTAKAAGRAARVQSPTSVTTAEASESGPELEVVGAGPATGMLISGEVLSGYSDESGSMRRVRRRLSGFASDIPSPRPCGFLNTDSEDEDQDPKLPYPTAQPRPGPTLLRKGQPPLTPRSLTPRNARESLHRDSLHRDRNRNLDRDRDRVDRDRERERGHSLQRELLQDNAILQSPLLLRDTQPAPVGGELRRASPGLLSSSRLPSPGLSSKVVHSSTGQLYASAKACQLADPGSPHMGSSHLGSPHGSSHLGSPHVGTPHVNTSAHMGGSLMGSPHVGAIPYGNTGSHLGLVHMGSPQAARAAASVRESDARAKDKGDRREGLHHGDGSVTLSSGPDSGECLQCEGSNLYVEVPRVEKLVMERNAKARAKEYYWMERVVTECLQLLKPTPGRKPTRSKPVAVYTEIPVIRLQEY
ncbi:protein tyrosine kinase [Gregarina niphandrodes]|uniref:non-specific serine/threonine protein kinase n=1 Tax=Gregarina niphandrodes TaxID=110365 RepID=A0A023BB88_GRENI|nr:protein tyrosine kinase [Gregarina niphandrodes]EZG79303.1 protein tyrosine kinase [Gregarina niphandrodes]|eukprot:XP_011129072.1 protein tyrosine kinase [Gregarina niphandrodes]